MTTKTSSSMTDRRFLKGRDAAKVAIVASLVLLCMAAAYYGHFVLHIEIVYTHFFYIPIVIAGFWWGRHAVWVALLLGAWVVACHYLSDLGSVEAACLLRSGMFILVALVTGTLRERRLKTERTLRETRDYLNKLLQYSSVPIMVWDRQSKITLFNAAFVRLTGYPTGQMIGQSLEALFPQENREEAYREINRTLEGEHWKAVEIPICCVDGHVAICLWNSANIYEPDGKTLVATVAQGQDITERTRAEEAIKLAHRELDQIFDTAADGMRVVDKDFNVLRINQTFSTLSGISKDEAVSKKCHGVFFGPQCHTPDCPLTRILSGEERLEYEVERERADGVRIPCILTAAPFRGPDGELVGIVENFKDITEHKRVEEDVRQKAEDLSLINSMNSAANRGDSLQEILDLLSRETARIFSCRGTTVYWLSDDRRHLIAQKGTRFPAKLNRRLEKLIGVRIPSELRIALEAGSTYQKALQAGKPQLIDDPAAIQNLIAECTDSRVLKKLAPGIYRILGIRSVITAPLVSEGEAIGLLDMSSSEPFAESDLQRVEVLSHQLAAILKRTWAEEALRESEARYRLLAENAVDVIWTMDMDLRLTYVSPSCTRLTGYTPEEAMTLTIEETHAPDSIEILAKAFAQELALEASGSADASRVLTLKLEYLRKDGSTVWAESALTFVRDVHGEPVGILGVTRDISERVRAEEEKARLETQLLQAQRIEAIGSLAGGVAHDFNNILTAIQGYTELALGTIERDHPLYRDLNEVRSASLRAANLTRQLLLFSRRQPMTIVPLDLNRVIRNLTAMLERIIGEDVRLTTELESGLWTVEGDAGTIEQVIMNMVVNARDAMPEGGRIAIRTENVYVDQEYCHTHSEARPGEFVCFSVVDTGLGIDPAIIDRVFEPFFTTKGPGKGSGMGLSVVYGIVKQHGGWVTVESSPGNGAAFRVYLPVAPISVEEEWQAPPLLQEGPRGRGERILLVEDEESVREFVTKALTQDGYTIHAAEGVQSALEVFEKEGRDFDLVFSDVVLPDGRGPILVERILELKPDVGVLLGSGYASDKSDWQLIQERGYRYLQKPYSLSELLATVRRVLDAR